jgi:hypothetical protein
MDCNNKCNKGGFLFCTWEPDSGRLGISGENGLCIGWKETSTGACRSGTGPGVRWATCKGEAPSHAN